MCHSCRRQHNRSASQQLRAAGTSCSPARRLRLTLQWGLSPMTMMRRRLTHPLVVGSASNACWLITLPVVGAAAHAYGFLMPAEAALYSEGISAPWQGSEQATLTACLVHAEPVQPLASPGPGAGAAPTEAYTPSAPSLGEEGAPGLSAHASGSLPHQNSGGLPHAHSWQQSAPAPAPWAGVLSS